MRAGCAPPAHLNTPEGRRPPGVPQTVAWRRNDCARGVLLRQRGRSSGRPYWELPQLILSVRLLTDVADTPKPNVRLRAPLFEGWLLLGLPSSHTW
jgi:hypothetical protein